MIKTIGLILIMIAVALIAASLYYKPPSLDGRTTSQAVRASRDTSLGALALASPREADSGVLPLIGGPDAFAARVALIRASRVALDVQYYIWQRDATGLILLDELRRAAERGVRVRLLLDDNGIAGLDRELAALDALPKVEVRLFNPFILRQPKALGYAFDFVRLNRRMHNKSLTADGAMSILGGRNIGDIYFGFGEGVHYVDTDVLVAGRAAAEVGADFDRYWASASAYPLDRIVTVATGDGLGLLQRAAADARTSAEGKLYTERLEEFDLLAQVADGRLFFEWTSVILVSDDPAKGVGRARQRDLLFPQLMALLSRPGQSIDLVSAYFVPGRQFTKRLAQAAGAGVRVRILTNSQAATDVMVVHSAYVNYRPALLEAGVELLELKPEYATRDEPDPPGGSSRASLHSKTLAIDGQRIFIGSFNFDPRSVMLNTEMGVVIDSPRIARALADVFAVEFPQRSYRPVMTDGGSLAWAETLANGKTLHHTTEPGTTLWSRLVVRVLGLLPIEWLL